MIAWDIHTDRLKTVATVEHTLLGREGHLAWPGDLTRDDLRTKFSRKVRKRWLVRYANKRRRCTPPFFHYHRETEGEFQGPSPIRARVNPRSDGVFPDPARRWGGRFDHPPAICQINGPILDLKTSFDSSRLELSEYVAKFYMSVTDDVTSRVNGQTFEYLSLLASPGKAAVSDWNKADGTKWIMSERLLSTLLSLCDLVPSQGHPR